MGFNLKIGNYHLPKEMLRGSVWKRRSRSVVRFASLIRGHESGLQAQERAYFESKRHVPLPYQNVTAWGV